MTRKANPNLQTREDQEAALREAMARARLKERRGKRMRPPPLAIGLAARKAVRNALKDYKGSPLSLIQERWPEIIGEKLASVCRPEKLSGKAGARTLTLKVLPAAALIVQHQTEIIRQRVSGAAGGDITKLKLVQGRLDLSTKPAPTKAAHLSASELVELEAELNEIEALPLRKALLGLGSAILAAEKT